MTIYNVEIKTILVVEARDEDDAAALACDSIHDAISNKEFNIESIDKIASIEELRGKWDGQCFPYGAKSNARLSELLQP